MRVLHLICRRGAVWPRLTLLLLLAGSVAGWSHGDLDERIGQLTVTLNQEPARAEAWIERAGLRRQHGDWAGALADADQAARLEPAWPPVFLERARILFDQQQYAAALEASGGCLEREPDNADALVIQAFCRAQLGQAEAAIADLNLVLRGPRNPLPDLYLERARLEAQQGRWRGAVKGLEEGMLRLGETPSLAFPAFEYERRAGDYPAALDRLETLQRFMSPESYLVTRGEVLTEAHRQPEAAEAFREALARLDRKASHPSPTEASLRARLVAGLENVREATGSDPNP